MSRRDALRAEVFLGAHHARPEQAGPEAVDRHARRQRVLLRDQPLCEAEPISRRILGQGVKRRRYGRLDRLPRTHEVAALVNECLALFIRGQFPEDRCRYVLCELQNGFVVVGVRIGSLVEERV